MTLDAKLVEAAVGCSKERAALLTPHLNEVCEAYQINTPQRIAAFLAQIGHESGSFRWLKEVWGPSAAQATYEGRANLGNTQPGDGARFMGRGLIQTTGRFNYAKLRDRLRQRLGDAPDFEATPEVVEEPRWAAWSAADFWDMNGLNSFADAGAFETITKRINGGYNGLEDRKARWERAKLALAGQPTPQPKGNDVLPFVAAALPAVISAVPALVDLFKGDSKSGERNAEAAKLVVGIAKEALNVRNEQELVETLQADPKAAAAVKVAVEAQWFNIAEAGGGGIAGARQADKEFVTGGARFWQSPSFWVLVLLLPLTYMVVGSLIGIWGTAQWSDDVRASIATAIITLIVGGAAGYYWGSTTSKNRPT